MSFEQACDAVLSRQADYVLVPVAYPKLNGFLMDSRLVIADYKVRPIPPLVLVHKNGDEKKKDFACLYLHPATEPLVAKFSIRYDRMHFCRSNEEVVDQLLIGDAEDGGITNLLAARAANLHPTVTLRSESPMGWVLLKRSHHDA